MRRFCFASFIGTFAIAAFFLVKIASPDDYAEAQEKEAAVTEPVPLLLETFGLLGGLQLYQTYLNIGFIADGKAQGVYSESNAKALLGSILIPLDSVSTQLTKSAKVVPAKEDQDALGKLEKITRILQQQGKSLETFWASGKESDGSQFESSRKQAWGEISALLGLNN